MIFVFKSFGLFLESKFFVFRSCGLIKANSKVVEFHIPFIEVQLIISHVVFWVVFFRGDFGEIEEFAKEGEIVVCYFEAIEACPSKGCYATYALAEFIFFVREWVLWHKSYVWDGEEMTHECFADSSEFFKIVVDVWSQRREIESYRV